MAVSVVTPSTLVSLTLGSLVAKASVLKVRSGKSLCRGCFEAVADWVLQRQLWRQGLRPTLMKGRGRSRLGPRRKSNAGSTNLSQAYGELWGKYYLSECPALGQNAWAFVLLHLRCGLSWGRPDLGRGGPL